jgi:hypothetical protein
MEAGDTMTSKQPLSVIEYAVDQQTKTEQIMLKIDGNRHAHWVQESEEQRERFEQVLRERIRQALRTPDCQPLWAQTIPKDSNDG